MPINNTFFGLWKVFSYGGYKYIVETADEKVDQNVTPKQYIIGTAMPRVLEVKGATATMDISAPLLVHNIAARTGGFIGGGGIGPADFVQDGLTLVKQNASFGGSSTMTPTFAADPFFIFKNVTFSVSANAGASYKVQAIGDYNALTSENTAATLGFGLSVPNPAVDADYPTSPNVVYRVASFYDIAVNIGGTFWTGLVQDLTVSVDYTIQDFAFIGQEDQRMWYGISGMSAKANGTLISSNRQPIAPYMPLQAQARYAGGTYPFVTPPTTPPIPPGTTLPTFGGMAWPTTGTFEVLLRDGTSGAPWISVLPNLGINTQRFIFSSSSLQASTGLLTTKFEGQMWAQTNQ